MHECNYVANGMDDSLRLINPMIDDAREITRRTFVLHVNLKDLYRALPYQKESRNWMLSQKNCNVRYYKSTFDGRPCYYVNWSAIEFVFAA